MTVHSHFWLRIACRFQWKPQDLWIGVYWKRKPTLLHVWICFVPCLPLHLAWVRVPLKFRDWARRRRG